MVLDPVDLKVHHLNASAAMVFERCDGHKSLVELVSTVPPTVPETEARRYLEATLELLAEANLLEPEVNTAYSGLGRRSFLKGMAKFAALPVVASVLIPTPSQASTCVPQGECENAQTLVDDPCAGLGNLNQGVPCCDTASDCNWKVATWKTAGAKTFRKWTPACCSSIMPCHGANANNFADGTCCSC